MSEVELEELKFQVGQDVLLYDYIIELGKSPELNDIDFGELVTDAAYKSKEENEGEHHED